MRRTPRTYYIYKDGTEVTRLDSINSAIKKAAEQGLFRHAGEPIGISKVLNKLNRRKDRFQVSRSTVNNWVYKEESLRADDLHFLLYEDDVVVLSEIIETILGYREETTDTKFAPESSYSSIEPVEILRKGLTTKKAAEYLKKHYDITISHEGVRHHCLSKLDPLPHEKREESPDGREVFLVHPAHLDEFAANRKTNKKRQPTPKQEEKNLAEQLESMENQITSLVIENDRLSRELALLKKLVVDGFRQTQKEHSDTKAMVEEVSKKQTLTSSWLRENFYPEWKEAGDE